MRLDDEDKRLLMAIAREAAAAAVEDRPYAPEPANRPALLERRGCFVTLRTRERLRGCLGCFTSDAPLYKTVADYAGHSVRRDPRFARDRLQIRELPDLAIDISVLSPLEPCRDPENIVLGVHGIYIEKDGCSGCFLPQVANETGWTVEELWGHCCRDKAGLDWNAWRAPDAKLLIFTAETVA